MLPENVRKTEVLVGMNIKHWSDMGKSWSHHKVGVKVSFPTFTSQ